MAKSTANLVILQRLNKQMPPIDVAANEKAKSMSVSALGDGINLGELGFLRWVDVNDTEESPWQTREGYDDEHIKTLEDSLNARGLIEVPPARFKPGSEGKIVQIGAGHCRTEAVRRGANAGSNLPDPERFAGKMLFWIRDLDDLDMAAIAVEENEARQNPNWIERAKGYVNLKAELKKAGLADETATWDFVAAKAKISKRRVHQIVALLDLPIALQKKIAHGIWNEKHGRAWLDLIDAPQLQEKLVAQIDKQKLSGSKAVERGPELRKLHPQQHDLDLGVATAKAIKKQKRVRAKVEKSNAAPSSLQLVGSAPAPLDAAQEAQKMAAELSPRQDKEIFAADIVEEMEAFQTRLKHFEQRLSETDPDPFFVKRIRRLMFDLSLQTRDFHTALNKKHD